MAKLSAFNTSVYGPDESAVGTIGNIAEMFNPENQAKGQLAQAHADYYKQSGAHAQASAALANAKAQSEKDQNAAYDVSRLIENGMSPLQAQMFVAARNHYADAAKGYNAARGGDLLATGQGDPNTAAALTGLNPTINSAFTIGQGEAIRNQNSANKIADTIAAGTVRNEGFNQRGTVVPSGGMFIPPGAGGKTSILNVPPGAVPAGAIINPKPDRGASASQINAVDARVRNGMSVLSDIVTAGNHGSQTLNPGDANAIVTAANAKYPNLPIHQAIPMLIKDQNIQFNEKPGTIWPPTSWFGHNAIIPTAGDKPVVQGLADIIAPSSDSFKGAPSETLKTSNVVPAGPVSKIGMLDENARATAKQRILGNPALRSDFDTKFGAGATDELLAK